MSAKFVTIEKVNYHGWPNSYRLSNGIVELIVVSDIGPRLIRYAFVGKQNIFKEFIETLGKSGEKSWIPRGGHRLWVAPEVVPITYALDNGPVGVTIKGNDTIETVQPVEPETGLQKSIEVTLHIDGTVEVKHRIKNTNPESRELSPWILSMMAPGGVGCTGFPPRGTHPEVLQPTHPLVMWAFTDFSDARWTFTQKYLILRQDPRATRPQKAGLFNPHTWGAYFLNNQLFIKQYYADPTKRYPDWNSSYETFTNADTLELETLGPLVCLAPNASTELIEYWSLHDNVQAPSQWTDEELDKILLPLLKKRIQ
jgi:hypothetical protein